jgi:hypothetical protein
VIVMAYPAVENVLQMVQSNNETFANRIGLGRLRRRPQHAHAHGGYALIQFPGEDAVPVVDEEPEGVIAREPFAQLLLRPLCAGVIGDIEMQDSSSSQFHENEHIKDTESGRDHDQEVTSRDRLSLIVDEGESALAGIGHGAGCGPQEVGAARKWQSCRRFQVQASSERGPSRAPAGSL